MFSKPLFESVPFVIKKSKGGSILGGGGGVNPLNPLGGYKKSAIGGLIFRGFKRVAPPPPPPLRSVRRLSCVRGLRSVMKLSSARGLKSVRRLYNSIRGLNF